MIYVTLMRWTVWHVLLNEKRGQTQTMTEMIVLM